MLRWPVTLNIHHWDWSHCLFVPSQHLGSTTLVYLSIFNNTPPSLTLDPHVRTLAGAPFQTQPQANHQLWAYLPLLVHGWLQTWLISILTFDLGNTFVVLPPKIKHTNLLPHHCIDMNTRANVFSTYVALNPMHWVSLAYNNRLAIQQIIANHSLHKSYWSIADVNIVWHLSCFHTLPGQQ